VADNVIFLQNVKQEDGESAKYLYLYVFLALYNGSFMLRV